VRLAENLADYLEILGDLTSCPGLEWESFIQSIWHNPVADATVNGILKGTEFFIDDTTSFGLFRLSSGCCKTFVQLNDKLANDVVFEAFYGGLNDNPYSWA
jgi:hypothetical protein